MKSRWGYGSSWKDKPSSHPSPISLLLFKVQRSLQWPHFVISLWQYHFLSSHSSEENIGRNSQWFRWNIRKLLISRCEMYIDCGCRSKLLLWIVMLYVTVLLSISAISLDPIKDLMYICHVIWPNYRRDWDGGFIWKGPLSFTEKSHSHCFLEKKRERKSFRRSTLDLVLPPFTSNNCGFDREQLCPLHILQLTPNRFFLIAWDKEINAFCNLDKYILKIGQIHCSIWTNTFYYCVHHYILANPAWMG